MAVKCHNGSHGGEGHATYNVPSGLAGDGGTALLADPVTLLVAGAILANLLLAGVLLRRRGARRSVVGR